MTGTQLTRRTTRLRLLGPAIVGLLAVLIAVMNAVAEAGPPSRQGAVAELGRSTSGAAIAVYRDERIVAMGQSPCAFPCWTRLALVRYSPTGVLDPSFGGNGIVTYRLEFSGPDGFAGSGRKLIVTARGVKGSLDPEGKISVIRFDSDGRLDKTFGSNGVATPDLSPYSTLVYPGDPQTDAQGRILIPASLDSGDAMIARLTRTGALDPSFGGGDGIAPLPVGLGAPALAIQPDGKIVAAGRDFALARLNVDGSLDDGFGGGDGVAQVPPIDVISFALDLASQSDGRIVASGEAGPGCRGCTTYAAAVRYTPPGEPDSSFGDQGVVKIANLGQASSVQVRMNGRIVLGGSAGPDFQVGAVTELSANGTIDGTYLDPLVPGFGSLESQSNGRVLTGGTVDWGGGDLSLAVVGLNKRLRPDRRFGGGDGTVITPDFVLGHGGCEGSPASAVGGGTNDRIVGTEFNDVIVALEGADTIVGRGGSDIICSGAGKDRVSGGAGRDTVYGSEGGDQIRGGKGADELFGQYGADRLLGGPGDDRLFGGLGNDALFGGAGDNLLRGGEGLDISGGR